jgi:hypothetical protein
MKLSMGSAMAAQLSLSTAALGIGPARTGDMANAVANSLLKRILQFLLFP